jgi:thiamine kinase-like enzyme
VLSLGDLRGTPVKVSGGLIHKMWGIETTRGKYAVKELNKSIQMTPLKKNEFENAEKMADVFLSKGILIVSAMPKVVTTIEDKNFIVYPWFDGKSLEGKDVTVEQIRKMAEILAAMHRLKVKSHDIAQPVFYSIARDKFTGLPNEEILTDLNMNAEEMRSVLEQNFIISHGDLDKKNVLWGSNGNPVLIDWESVAYVNPVMEIINAALDWSGWPAKEDKADLFITMIRHYKEGGGKIDGDMILPALYGIARNWIDWLLFNVFRNEKELATVEIEKTMKTLLTLSNNIFSIEKAVKES